MKTGIVLKWLCKSPVLLSFSPFYFFFYYFPPEGDSGWVMCLHANVCACVHFYLHFVGCEWYNTHTQPPCPIVFQGHEWGLYEREFPPVKPIRPANILTSGINTLTFPYSSHRCENNGTMANKRVQDKDEEKYIKFFFSGIFVFILSKIKWILLQKFKTCSTCKRCIWVIVEQWPA